MRHIMRGLVFSIFFAVPTFADESWTILPEHAACLLENLEQYQSSPDEPVIIFLGVCPVFDRMEAMSKLQQNNGALPAGPSVVVLQDGSSRNTDDVIVYTHDELVCLGALNIGAEEPYVVLPQEPCDP